MEGGNNILLCRSFL